MRAWRKLLANPNRSFAVGSGGTNARDFFSRRQRKQVYRRFGTAQRQWLLDLYYKKPVIFIDEARDRFQRHFKTTISAASVIRILKTAGLTWKKIERRAIQIRKADILR